MPAPAGMFERALRVWFTSALAIGVQSVASWPCGQAGRLQPGCHRRRDLRHEACGGGYWFLTAGLVPYFYGRYLTGSVASSLRD
jgi:hypothetical protein